jgi:DNA-binding transcriptional MerR regulator
MAEDRVTIDELARLTGMTARNIRAYQTRGLLPPPRLVGRTGYYDSRHVERLRLIAQMQAEGLNLNAINWLVGGATAVYEAGVRLLKRALLEPGTSEEPEDLTVEELARRLGGLPSPELVVQVTATGMIRPLDDGRVRVVLPSLLRRAEEMVALGIPIDAQLQALVTASEAAHTVARSFLGLVRDQVLAPFEARGRPEEELDEIRQTLETLRPIATEVLLGVYHLATTEEIDRFLETPPAPGAVA